MQVIKNGRTTTYLCNKPGIMVDDKKEEAKESLGRKRSE